MASADGCAIDVPVAIVGMAARSAGGPDVDALWRLLRSGGSAFVEVPADRVPGFDHRTVGVEVTPAALLDRIDSFDAEFFEVSPRQAAFMDPRQRMLLEETWHALEDAGISPDTLAGSDTGVFIASSDSDFRHRIQQLGVIDQYTTTGTMHAFLANRLSYQFDWHGASMVVDTACSAGLTAVTQAAAALSAGQIPLAVVGGVTVICHGFDHEAFFKAGVLSRAGRICSFSGDADGYVRGEGVAVVVLKRLADAERDGDPIRAVILGAAQRHDGRSGGQFSPDAGMQAELIRRATARAGLTPDLLGYIEAHSPGTQAGDPTEVKGLIEALGGQPAAAGPDGSLWVGSLKGNIGHTEAAAGMFGLIKAVLVLENAQIPAIPGFTGLRGDIQLGSVPLAFPVAPVGWPRQPGKTRFAGVSSFGLGGANAHVVLSEAPAGRSAGGGTGPGSRLFPLSAATPASLAGLAARLAGWITGHPGTDLGAMAWTLQAGRRAMTHRAVLTGQDAREIAAAAADLAGGRHAGVPAGVPPQARAPIEAFLAGRYVGWQALWDQGALPHRIPLVPYPFEPRSHWPRTEPAPAPLPAPLPPPVAADTPAATARPFVHLPSPADYVAAVTAPAALSEPPVAGPPSPADYAAGVTAPVAPSEPLVAGPPAAVDPAVGLLGADTAAGPSAGQAAPRPAAQGAPAMTAAAAMSGAADHAALERLILDTVSEVLYLPPGKIGPEQDFISVGLDSILAVEFVQQIRARTGLELTTAQLYATRTARALARDLAGGFTPPSAAPAGTPAAGSPVTAGSAEIAGGAVVAGGAPRPGRAAADGDGARLAGASAADGPLSGLREKLCGMAADCLYLPRDKVDPDAEFTAIGLDSVLAVEFVSLTNAEFGTSLTIQALREHPTVAELAVYLSQSASRPREEAGR